MRVDNQSCTHKSRSNSWPRVGSWPNEALKTHEAGNRRNCNDGTQRYVTSGPYNDNEEYGGSCNCDWGNQHKNAHARRDSFAAAKTQPHWEDVSEHGHDAARCDPPWAMFNIRQSPLGK